jgi:dihydroorotase
LSAAVADGTIDAIASDHAPLDDDAKLLPFAEAVPGVSAVELLLPLTLRWAQSARVPLARAVDALTAAPARVLGISCSLAPGAVADLIVVDPSSPWRVTRAALLSQGLNTPFMQHEMSGRVRWVVRKGAIIHRASARIA